MLAMFGNKDPDLLPVALFFVVCSIVGIFGNSLIVLCTVKMKRFRSPCHILVCLTCLADILHLAGHFPFCVQFFMSLWSTQAECYFMMILPIIGLTISGPLILAMGIDRLIAIQFPMTYRHYHDHPKCYLFVQLIFPIAYSTFFIVYGAIESNPNPEFLLFCGFPISLNGFSFAAYTHSNTIILLLVFFVYLAVSIILKNSKASTKLRSVFRSIAVIVVVLLFGWMATMVASVVVNASDMELRDMFIAGMYVGVPVSLPTSSNVLVFYFINPEYRMAIQSLIFCNSNLRSSPQMDRISSYQGGNSDYRRKSTKDLGVVKI